MSENHLPPAEPSKLAAALAAATPVLFAPIGCGLVLATNRVYHLNDTTLWNHAALALGPLCALGIALALYFAGRGRSVPVAVVLFVALVPWTLTTLAGTIGMSSTVTSLDLFAASDAAVALAASFSALVTGQKIGGALTALLLAGSALGLAIAAVGQRAPGRTWFGLGPGLFAAGFALAPAVMAVVFEWRMSLVSVATALAGALACVLAAPASGKDAPRFRSVALSSGAVFAAVLASVPAAAATYATYTASCFEAIATVFDDPERFLADLTAELAPFGWFLSLGALGALAAGGATAAYGLARARRLRPAFVAGAAAACAAAALAGGLGTLADSGVGGALETISTPDPSLSLP